jgi:hypothetical protein
MLGIDHLMFSVDYPFQDNFAAMQFLDRCGQGAVRGSPTAPPSDSSSSIAAPTSGAEDDFYPAHRHQREHEEINWAISKDLVGDVHIAAPHVANPRSLRHKTRLIDA